MAHHNQDVEIHHEGDAHEIEVTVEHEDGSVVDLTTAEAEWLLLDSQFDDSEEALLSKDGVEDGTDNGITFPDPNDGVLLITIETGDTDGIVDWETDYDGDDIGPSDTPHVDFHHRLRVTLDGDRATVFHGTFSLYR